MEAGAEVAPLHCDRTLLGVALVASGENGNRIMQPFFSTKARGAGMGLAIARGIALGHRGRLAMLDREGGGAELRLEIPVDLER